ncbi:MAG: H+/Na+-translocating ferredoxin:NAD+ oxidoreductase subunit [Clostridiales bacterium]|nr:H+/Na+-translocating ferredoxin:NAD+ oxidoreductase subunit [Clostridiales bacterium]
MNQLLGISTMVMGGTGVLFALLLTYTSKKFAVEKDTRIEEIEEVLPGANCGACGYPGCSAYAEAIVQDEASITLCPVGGTNVASQIGGIMGIEVEGANEPLIARIKCDGGKNCTNTFEYRGIQDCHAADALHGGQQSCKYGCLGLGSCVAVCPFGAININENGVAEVDPTKCTGCGVCVKECPKAVIDLVPQNAKVHVLCKNKERGKEVRQKCQVGCIACKICERTCEHDAIKVENNVAKIDYSKCVNCMACVNKCPTKAIKDVSKNEASVCCHS